jgi:hypothetical protein
MQPSVVKFRLGLNAYSWRDATRRRLSREVLQQRRLADSRLAA